MSEGADAGEPAARFRCARGWAARAPRPGGAAGSSSRVGPGRVLRGAPFFLMISVSGPGPATHRCPLPRASSGAAPSPSRRPLRGRRGHSGPAGGARPLPAAPGTGRDSGRSRAPGPTRGGRRSGPHCCAMAGTVERVSGACQRRALERSGHPFPGGLWCRCTGPLPGGSCGGAGSNHRSANPPLSLPRASRAGGWLCCRQSRSAALGAGRGSAQLGLADFAFSLGSNF